MATRIYKTPFAATGDKEALATADQPDGKVSLQAGWTPDYELPNDNANYRPVGRTEMNGILSEVTESLGEVQLNGFAKWLAIDGGWPLNAIAVHSGVVYISTSSNNTDTPGGAGVSWRILFNFPRLGSTPANWDKVALLESPTFLGTPTGPTPGAGDKTNKLATTEFVQSAVAGVASPPATTLVSGISRRATTPEAQAFTSSDVTISPASLRAAFQGANYSATFNGYQVLPSGIIEQWGVVPLVTLPANSTSDAVVTFPMAFAANALSIAVSVETPAPTQVSCSVMTDTLTTTGVTLRRGNSSTSTPWNVVVRYRVIGR